MKKAILDVINETALDLHDAGVMDDVTLKEFDALCLPPGKTYSTAQNKRIRQRCKKTQRPFSEVA